MWQLRARLVFEDCKEAEEFSNQSPVRRSMAIQAALDVPADSGRRFDFVLDLDH
jgi:hypothetical protein